MTGTGLVDFVRTIKGYEMYFSDAYPIGEANADDMAAFQYSNADDFLWVSGKNDPASTAVT
jgi:hypothetical protein